MKDDERPQDQNAIEDPLGDYKTNFPAAVPVADDSPHIEHMSRTLWGDAWGRMRKNRLTMIALTYLLIVIILAVTADLWVPKMFGDPRQINSQTAAAHMLEGPSLQHPMGTDELGRDIFGRVIYGARVSLTVGVVATAIALVIGVLLGALSGFFGGLTDTFTMRITDIFLAFPYILFSILILAIIPSQYRGVIPVILAIGLLGWPSFARLFRSSVISVKENDYVDAGRAVGAGNSRLMFRHIMPNAVAPVVVYATMSIGGAILAEAALSFLGIGVQPPQISWGRMIEDGTPYLVSNPGLILWPGLAILLTVLSFTLLGDGVRDALDVKMGD